MAFLSNLFGNESQDDSSNSSSSDIFSDLDAVVGVDISPSMLAEARRNCDREGLDNVVLAPSDDDLSGVRRISAPTWIWATCLPACSTRSTNPMAN